MAEAIPAQWALDIANGLRDDDGKLLLKPWQVVPIARLIERVARKSPRTASSRRSAVPRNGIRRAADTSA